MFRQLLPWQLSSPSAAYMLARCGPVAASRTANAARVTAAVMAWMRN